MMGVWGGVAGTIPPGGRKKGVLTRSQCGAGVRMVFLRIPVNNRHEAKPKITFDVRDSSDFRSSDFSLSPRD